MGRVVGTSLDDEYIEFVCAHCQNYVDTPQHYYTCVFQKAEEEMTYSKLMSVVSLYSMKTDTVVHNLNDWGKLADACETYGFFLASKIIRHGINRMYDCVQEELNAKPYYPNASGEQSGTSRILWSDGKWQDIFGKPPSGRI